MKRRSILSIVAFVSLLIMGCENPTIPESSDPATPDPNAPLITTIADFVNYMDGKHTILHTGTNYPDDYFVVDLTSYKTGADTIDWQRWDGNTYSLTVEAIYDGHVFCAASSGPYSRYEFFDIQEGGYRFIPRNNGATLYTHTYYHELTP